MRTCNKEGGLEHETHYTMSYWSNCDELFDERYYGNVEGMRCHLTCFSALPVAVPFSAQLEYKIRKKEYWERYALDIPQKWWKTRAPNTKKRYRKFSYIS
jgi:hypothetical protein